MKSAEQTKESRKIASPQITAHVEGDIGGYPIPQYRKKKWQIPKYRVENRLNTDTAYFNHIYNRFPILMAAAISAFNYPRHLCTRFPCFCNILVVRKFSLKSKLHSFNLLTHSKLTPMKITLESAKNKPTKTLSTHV